MTIAWNAFTPLPSFLGGALIGLAAVALLLGLGRIAGISGIVAGVLRPTRDEWRWRAAFVAGMLAAPWAFGMYAVLPLVQIDASWGAVMLAGLLVGIGTRYGDGCTSGHGICGLSRLSPRSLVATLAFMASGFVTVYLLRHVWGAA